MHSEKITYYISNVNICKTEYPNVPWKVIVSRKHGNVFDTLTALALT